MCLTLISFRWIFYRLTYSGEYSPEPGEGRQSLEEPLVAVRCVLGRRGGIVHRPGTPRSDGDATIVADAGTGIETREHLSRGRREHYQALLFKYSAARGEALPVT